MVGRWEVGPGWDDSPEVGLAQAPACQPLLWFLHEKSSHPLPESSHVLKLSKRRRSLLLQFLSGTWSQLDVGHDVIVSWWCQLLSQLSVNLLEGFHGSGRVPSGDSTSCPSCGFPFGPQQHSRELTAVPGCQGICHVFCPLQVPVFTHPPHMHN